MLLSRQSEEGVIEGSSGSSQPSVEGVWAPEVPQARPWGDQDDSTLPEPGFYRGTPSRSNPPPLRPDPFHN